jgi:hypothetical protein
MPENLELNQKRYHLRFEWHWQLHQMNSQLNQKAHQLHFELHDSSSRNIAGTSEASSIVF